MASQEMLNALSEEDPSVFDRALRYVKGLRGAGAPLAQSANEAMANVLGPHGRKAVTPFVGAANVFTQGADLRDMVDFSGKTVDSIRGGDLGGAAVNALYTAAAPIGMVLPGSVGGYKRGVEALGDAVKRSADDLPTDEASRMARAREMGFDTDVYHGTGSDFDEFDGVSFFGDPKTASSYAADRGYGGGANVMPVKLKIRNPATDDDIFAAAKNAGVYESDLPAFTYISPNVVGPEQSKKVLDILKGQGFDGAKVSDYGMDDPFNSVTSWATFDPKNIRSRFAKFDPAKAGSADILAGLAGLGVLGAGAAALPQDDSDMVSALRGM